MIRRASSAGIMPFAPSMDACAMLPAISCRYMRLSKEMEELKSSASLLVSPAVRPAQSFATVNRLRSE